MNLTGVGMSITLVLYVGMVLSQTCTSPTSSCDCFIGPDGLKVINCRYKGLTQVPTFTKNSVLYDKIIFTSTEETGTCTPNDGCNDITRLSADAFLNLSVKVIDLRNNAISSFDANAFRGLETTLDVLLIEGDGSNSPPYNSISVLQSLRSLHLENFQQTDMLGSNTNLSFPELLTLTLDKMHQLSSIQSTAFQTIPNVQELNLQNMRQLVNLPIPAIRVLHSLKTLNVLHTGVQRVYGDSFDNLDNLQAIYFNSNADLVTIDPTAFRGVTDTLEFLYLDQNQLTTTMLSMFNQYDWPMLTQLHLGYNNFGTIPSGSFRGLTNLVYLELQDIGLTSIDHTMFTGLQNLHTLDLGYNSISSVAVRTFRNIPLLKELRMNYQSTSGQITFAQHAFQGIEQSLERLYLEQNVINATDLWNIIQSLKNIVELNIANLDLFEIPDHVFRFNTKLTTLDLSENRIAQLKQETFYGLRDSLRSINLNSNMIRTVSRCVLSDFAMVPIVRLDNNQLSCDCRIAWLYDWVYAQPDPTMAAIYDVGTCASPAALRGQFLFQFNRSDLTCTPDYVPPVCLDLYTTTTTTPATNTTTIATTTTTSNTTDKTLSSLKPTKPIYEMYVVNKTAESITLSWNVTDRADVKGYLIQIVQSDATRMDLIVPKELLQYTINGLTPGNQYQFCLFLIFNGGVDYNPEVSFKMYCKTATPLIIPDPIG